MPTLVQIEAFKQKAKAKGFTDAQIQASIQRKIQAESQAAGTLVQGPQRTSPEKPVAPAAPVAPTAPTASITPTQPAQQKSLLRKGVDFLAGGASRFGEALGNAGGMIATEGSFQSTQKQYFDSADRLTQQAIALNKAGRKAEAQKMFKMAQDTLSQARNEANTRISDAKKGKEDTIKGAIGTAANFVPGGESLGFGGKVAAGITAGAMAGYGASDTGKGLEGAVGGGVVGGAIPVAGAIAGKALKAGKGVISKVGANLTKGAEEKATQDFIKASPSAFQKAITEHGIDPRQLYEKYAKGKSYDELLGLIKEKGKGGILNEGLNAAEKAIQKTSKTAGSNVRISGDDLIKALKTEAKSINTELGGQNRAGALKEIIKQAESKYKKGLTVKQALTTLRAANEKFGKSVVDDSGDAVASAAQKLEANTLRSTLKKMFPGIADALDKQSEILTFRPMIEKARASTLTTGAGKSKIGFGDIMAIGQGAMAGGAAGGPAGAIAGGIGVGAVRYAANNPNVEAAVGSVVSKVGNASIPALDPTLSRVGSNIASGVVGGAFSKPTNQDHGQPNGQEGNQSTFNSVNDNANQITPSETNAPIITPSSNDTQSTNDLFHGLSKREVLTRAVQAGAGESDLKKIADLYDQVAPKADEWSGMTVAELAKSRKDLTEGGYDTSAIDKELQKRGVVRASTSGAPKPVVDQINNLPTGTERNGARAVKDIMDVVDTAITSAKDTPTGPLSAGEAGISKLTTPNKTAQLEKDLSEILRTIRKESTGVAFSEKEITDLEKEIPTILQQEGNVEDSLLRLKRRMIQKLANYGVDASSPEDSTTESSKKKTESAPISEAKPKEKTSTQDIISKNDAMSNIMFTAGPSALNEGAKKLAENKNPVISSIGKVAKVATSFIAPSDEQVALMIKGYKDPKSLTDKERSLLASSALMGTAGTVAPLSGQKVGKILPNLDQEDLKGMINLVDFVRTKMVQGEKVNPEAAVEIEKTARYIAEGMKINPDQANAKLANAFEQILNTFRKRAMAGTLIAH